MREPASIRDVGTTVAIFHYRQNTLIWQKDSLEIEAETRQVDQDKAKSILIDSLAAV